MEDSGRISDMPEYKVWHGIKDRCLNPNSCNWKRYGGRGIRICNAWKNSFPAFYEDVGPRPSENHSIDRIDNDGHYEPGNCRWATPEEQAYNRSTNIFVTLPDGNIVTSKKAMEVLGLSKQALFYRLNRGNDLTTPVKAYKKKYLYKGKEYFLGELAELAVVDSGTLASRISSGMDVEAAVETPVKVTDQHLVNGYLSTVQQICERYGVADYNLRHHIRNGLTAQQALDFLLHGIVPEGKMTSSSRKQYLYNGAYYTVSGLSKLSGISTRIISGRLCNGMSVEQAMTQPIKVAYRYLIDGREMNLKDLSVHLKIPYMNIRRYVKKGMSLDDLIKLSKKN